MFLLVVIFAMVAINAGGENGLHGEQHLSANIV